MASNGKVPIVSRRTLLIGGGVGAGLVLAWGLWPRRYEPNLRAAPGETLFNAFLKIGTDGRVIVAVPQAELGQGVYTSLPQILADELGADWSTVAVEPAPISPLYANRLLSEQLGQDDLPAPFRGVASWVAREYATRSALMLTGGSTSVRAFEAPLREAGAAARALLSKAAAVRWNVDWESLDTHRGFVWNGSERLSFGELAEAAVREKLPGDLPVREGSQNRLMGEPLPRIDLPSKVDGSAQFAGDIRLGGMVFASVRQGPTPASRLVRIDRAAIGHMPGLLSIVENPHWLAAIGTNWWVANRAVERMAPRFETPGGLVSSADMERTLTHALDNGEGEAILAEGDVAAGLAAGKAFRATYFAGPAPTAALEPLSATARLTGDRLEIWAATQAPAFARAAAARAAGLPEAQVILYPTLGGGGYGRRLEHAAIEQAAIIATRTKRPVQLSWSRIEESLHDSFRPPARAVLTAALGNGGSITAWRARIAAPAAIAQVAGRLAGEKGNGATADASAVSGARPPYAVQALAIDHVPVDVGIAAGIWRSGADSYTAFFTESFVDELARQAKVEPLSFRMQLLRDNPRLARALSTAAVIGGWDGGGPGSTMGLAAHSAYGSHAALLVEVEVDPQQRIRVLRAVCAVDCGRVVNPEIVRQQVEGAILFGIAGATGNPLRFENGLPAAHSFGELGLPTLARSPDVTVELIPSDEPPGGVTELGVPPVAPAIANAMFALTGRRLRSLPLVVGGS